MKCPKCGFTGFDHLDDCKKCGNDLTAYKARFNLRGPLVAPATPLTPQPPAWKAEEPQAPPAPVPEPVSFGYGFMDDEGGSASSSSSPIVAEAPADFSFAEEESFPPAVDEFALETTSADSAVTEESEVGAGEFLDLELDLSWDEKPTATAETPTDPVQEEENAFELPSLDDLPPLEGDLAGEDDATDALFLDDLGELPDLADLEEERERDKPAGSEGGRRDPFDVRGSVDAERAPATSHPPAPTENRLSISESLQLQEPFSAPPAGGERHGNGMPSAVSETPFSPEAELPCPPPEGCPLPLVHRVCATVVDVLLLGGAFALFVAAGEFVIAPEAGRLLPSASSTPDLLIPYLWVLFFLCFFYSTLFHYLLGQTVGKMAFGLRVAGEEDAPLLFSQALRRSFGGVLSFLCAGAGYVPLLSGGLSWGDRLAGTRVLRHQPMEIVPLEEGA